MTKKPNTPRSPYPADPAPPRPVEDILTGGGVRGEVPGCPTGLSGLMPQRPAPEETEEGKPDIEKLEPRQGDDEQG